MTSKQLEVVKKRLQKKNVELRKKGERPLSLAEYLRTLPGGDPKVRTAPIGRKRSLSELDGDH